MKLKPLLAASALALSNASHAQIILDLAADDAVLGPPGSGFPQQTTVRLTADFDSASYQAVAALGFDFTFSEGALGVNWTGNHAAAPFDFIELPGNPGPGALGNIIFGQEGPPGAVPDPQDPATLWEISYTATDFSAARDVEFATATGQFRVYNLGGAGGTTTILPVSTEGFGTLRVVPEPKSTAVVIGATCLGVCAAVRRRRHRVQRLP